MMAPAATIYIVDDDPSVRKSLARVMASVGYAVETFASAADFIARRPFAGPCCVILDVRMPGLTGLDLQETLADAEQRIPIVFVTGHGDIPMSVQAMKAGALDFLTKPYNVENLVSVVHRAIAQNVRDHGEAGRTTEVLARVKRLTPRETEVFVRVVTGMLNKQIAVELGIGEGTVKVHRARVMEKMQARSVAELVRLADRAGVIVPAPPGAPAP